MRKSIRHARSTSSLAPERPGPLSAGPVAYGRQPLSARSAGFESLVDFGLAQPTPKGWFHSLSNLSLASSTALCDEEGQPTPLYVPPRRLQKAHARRARRSMSPVAEHVSVQEKRSALKKAKDFFRKKQRS